MGTDLLANAVCQRCTCLVPPPPEDTLSWGSSTFCGRREHSGPQSCRDHRAPSSGLG